MKLLILFLVFQVYLNSYAQDNLPILPNGWHVHDMKRPLPEKVYTGKTDSDAPSDAKRKMLNYTTIFRK